MQVESTVKVNGKMVKQHMEQVDGTLEQLEEKIHALSPVYSPASSRNVVRCYGYKAGD